MNSFSTLKNRNFKTIIATTIFAFVVGSSFALAQRGGGSRGHVGGAAHVGGGGARAGDTGGGHATGGTGRGQHAGGDGEQPMGRGQPTGGDGHRQGTPRAGAGGVAGRPDPNHSRGPGNGRGSDRQRPDNDHHHFDGRRADHPDHPRFDHGDHNRHFDHHHHDHDHNHHHHWRVFYDDPFFWGYPYYPYDPYPEYAVPYSDYGATDSAYGVFDTTRNNPSETKNGGISFSVTPADALVYVDGTYKGIASSFDSGSQPLSLAAGSHLIELTATGYVPRAFEVNVVAGQVVPCQVSLTPQSDR